MSVWLAGWLAGWSFLLDAHAGHQTEPVAHAKGALHDTAREAGAYAPKETKIDFDNMNTLQTVFVVLGHLSFALTFLSFTQTNLIRLRIIAVVSQVLGLAYNGWVNYKMPEGQDIHLVVFWLAMFLILNIYMLMREIATTLEVPLATEDRELLVKSFPTIHSRDWVELMKRGTKKTFQKDAVLLAVGDSTKCLQLIVKGKAVEIRDGVKKECESGTLWGELTYVMGNDYYNSSPVDIIVSSDSLTLMEWPYELLRSMAKNKRFDAALQNGFVHSAGMKHGLLVKAQGRREPENGRFPALLDAL